MATAKVLGSFNILSGSDPLKYGYGDLNLNRHLQLTGVGINHQIDNQNDATGSISVVSGGYLTAESKSGNNSILTNSANANGSIVINQQNTGTGSVDIDSSGSGGITVNTSHASGAISIASAQNFSVTALQQGLLSSVGPMTMQSSLNDVVVNSEGSVGNVDINAGSVSGSVTVDASSIAATAVNTASLTTSDVAGTVTISGGSSTGSVNMDAQNITIGGTNSSVITLGHASTVTTLPGSLIVQGMTTNVDTTNTTISDNLIVLHSAPIAGKDAGVLFKRNVSDVVIDNASLTTTLVADASSGLSSFTINDDSYDYTGAIVQLFEGVNTENFTVTSVTRGGATQILTVDTPLVNSYTSGGCVVKVFTRSSGSLFYDEAMNEFSLVETNTVHTESNIGVKNYAKLHIGSLTIDDGNFASLADGIVFITANDANPVVIPQTRLRGSYQVIVTGSNDDQATATFFISKSLESSVPSIFRTTSSASSTGEEVSLTWGSNEQIKLYHESVRVSGNLTESIAYKVKFITNV